MMAAIRVWAPLLGAEATAVWLSAPDATMV